MIGTRYIASYLDHQSKFSTSTKVIKPNRNLPQKLDALVVAVGASDEGDKPVKEILGFLVVR